MTSLKQINQAAEECSADRANLTIFVTELQQELDRVKQQHLPRLKKAIARAAASQDRLFGLVESAPELFDKPKTQVFFDFRVGWRKGSGKLTWDDDDQVVKLIKKLFPDQADVLIKTEETPVKKALLNLDVADLRRLGCCVESTGEVPFVKPVDGEVEKTVNALLKDATKEAA